MRLRLQLGAAAGRTAQCVRRRSPSSMLWKLHGQELLPPPSLLLHLLLLLLLSVYKEQLGPSWINLQESASSYGR
jgi:hypothetical protein